MDNRQLGAWGEKKAANYLRLHGYKIVDMNCRYRQGEIDIVASKRGYIVFVEVKLRKTTHTPRQRNLSPPQSSSG